MGSELNECLSNAIHKSNKDDKLIEPIPSSQDRSSKDKLMKNKSGKEERYGFYNESIMRFEDTAAKPSKPSNKIIGPFKRAVNKIGLNKNMKEKSIRQVMEGIANSFQKGFFYIVHRTILFQI